MKIPKNFKEKPGKDPQKFTQKKAYTCEHSNRPLYALGVCRSCYEKDLRKRNPEYAARQRQNCRDWIKKYGDKKKKYDKSWRLKQDKNYRRICLLRRYGLTIDDFDSMLKKQGNKCAICGRKSKKGEKPLHVDHDHATGNIRGLLCFRCNFGLTYFSEDSDVLKVAAKYLAKSEIRDTAC